MRAAGRVRAPGTPPATVARMVLGAPLRRGARRELAFCLAGLPFAVPFPLLVFFLAITLGRLGSREANPSLWHVAAAAVAAVAAVVLFVACGAARATGDVYRNLAASLLGRRIPAPTPLPAASGTAAFAARLRDRASWRAFGYLMLRFPVSVLGWYATFCWVAGLVNMSFPFWWLSFRNHSPGVHLSAVPVFTLFGWGTFWVATFPGTFAAMAAGAGMLLAAPWLTRAVVVADHRLMLALLGPGTLRQRLRDLEQTRALAVDDTAAVLRQVERNLHDGAQIRLATLAMNLGMAREKLGSQPDLAAARDLIDAAHQGAKDALSELRELARGIHPPALDNGLPDALATLAAGSAATLTVDIPRRPTPAIETIAYFCAAELLANAVKHSSGSRIEITAAQRQGVLQLTVADDGTGGADPAAGTGLAGLAQRIRTVDGRLDISSPPGGPTRITAELPLRA